MVTDRRPRSTGAGFTAAGMRAWAAAGAFGAANSSPAADRPAAADRLGGRGAARRRSWRQPAPRPDAARPPAASRCGGAGRARPCASRPGSSPRGPRCRCRSPPPRPRIMPSSDSSKVAPRMMLASGSTSSRMRVAASSTSNRVQVLAAGDRDEQALGALHRGFVEERIGDRRLGRLDGAAVARGFAGAHHRLAHLAHHRADVGEVEIDQAFLDHQVGDAGDAGIEHLVGHREGVGEGGLLVGDRGTGSGWG